MPSIRCITCGRMHYGWALKYKQCSCDYCGQTLNRIVKGKSVYVRAHIDE